MSSPSSDYFSSVLPDYDKECASFSALLALVFVFWMVIFPLTSRKMAAHFKSPKTIADDMHTKRNESEVARKEEPKVTSPKGLRQRCGKGKKPEGKSVQIGSVVSNKASGKAAGKQPHATYSDDLPEIPAVNAISALGFMISSFYILMTMSPYNYFLARGVFQAPVLTGEECEKLLNISNRVAQRNYQMALEAREQEGEQSVNDSTRGLLLEPFGWQKFRHGSYPTTDLNIVTDPFDREDQEWLKAKLDARLAPTLERIYGIPAAAIRANDMFVVRYDSEYRAFLTNHTDDAQISVNILLTDDFEGGGTQFWHRPEEKPFAHVKPKNIGQMLTHSALINHEGMPVTKGTRIIFVGFLNVDRFDPFAAEAQSRKSRLNVFSSWLCLPWINVKFKEAYKSAGYRRKNKVEKWSNNKYAVSFFLDLANVLSIVGDYFAQHHVENLVTEEDTEKHLKALDEAVAAKQQSADPGDAANWFAGQQIDVDIDGTITQEWITRVNGRNRFMEL